MPDSIATKMQKQVIREQLLALWDIKIPASRVSKLTLEQLQGIRAILQKEPKQ